MRFFKVNAALLALILGVLAGVLLFASVRIFGKFTEFGTPLNFIGWFGFWFISLPFYLLPRREVSDVLWLPAYLLQLWLIFFVGIVSIRFVLHKNNPRTLKMIIAVLTIVLITSFSLLIHSQLWQNSNWRGEVGYLADIQGAEEANRDFQAGKLKIFVISGECHEDRFSGTNNGPFEVWTAQYYPSLPWPGRYSTEQKIKSYNLVMQSKYHWSLTHTNNVKSNR